MRVLAVSRISKDTEESTAIVRQRAAQDLWAQANGHEIVAYVSDEGISGSVPPWDRPELGKWLNEPGRHKHGEKCDASCHQPETFDDWDAIVVWRLDRLARRVVPLRQTLDLLIANGKTVISTSEGFDPTTPMGQIFVTILAALAEGELEAIKERNRNTAQHLINTGGDRGSLPPYGYVRDGMGGLIIEPQMRDDIRLIANRLLDGHTLQSVCKYLNDNGILTAKDAYWRACGKYPRRDKDGNELPPYQWSNGTLRRTMRNRTLLGEAVTRDKDGNTIPVLDSAGQVVMRASEAVLTPQEFEQVGAVLDGRARPQKRRGRSAVLGVAFCECGAKIHSRKYEKWHYYACGMARGEGTSVACPKGAGPIRAAVVHEYMRTGFVAAFGDVAVTRRVYVPGTDHTEELESVVNRLEMIDRMALRGAYDGVEGEAKYLSMRKALNTRQLELEATPKTPAQWIDEPTGETWADKVERLDDVALGDAMRDAGIVITIHASPKLPDGDDMDRLTLDWPAAPKLTV